MKKISLYLTVLCIALTGCGKKEEPSAEVANVAPPASEETVVNKVEAEGKTAVKTAESLVASGIEAVNEAAPELKQKVDAITEAASSMDFSKMTWDKVSDVSYSDKLQLASWAASQADGWKGKLKDAAMNQGMGMLSNIGDTGWQGALKKVMDSINAVRESSPETFELARGALVSAWGMFEEQAAKVIGE